MVMWRKMNFPNATLKRCGELDLSSKFLIMLNKKNTLDKLTNNKIILETSRVSLT